MKNTKEISPEGIIAQILHRYWKTGFIVIGLIAVSYGSFLGWAYIEKVKEINSQEELFKIQKAVESKAEELQKEFDKKNEVVKGEKLKSPPVKIDKNPESLVKHFSQQLGQYDKFIGENINRNSAALAALKRASLALEYKDPNVAETGLRKVLNSVSKDNILFGLVRTQLATIYMNQKKYDEARSLLSEVTQNSKLKYLHPHALLRLATCYIETGDLAKAKSLLVQVESEFPQTNAAREAKSLQKIVSLKKGE